MTTIEIADPRNNSRIAKITFGCDELGITRFHKALKRIINTDKRHKVEDLEHQASSLLFAIANFSISKFEQRYNVNERLSRIDFFHKMNVLLEASDNTVEVSDVKLKLFVANQEDTMFKEFKMPQLVNGSRHFLRHYINFLYNYYDENPPIKHIKGLDDKFTDQVIMDGLDHYNAKGKGYLNDNILADRGFMFHLNLLTVANTFPQYPPSKKNNSVLSEAQGRFIIQVTRLLNYNPYTTKGLEVINPNFEAVEYITTDNEIRELRDKLKSLQLSLNRLQNSI
jgi:hypothetical protein